MLDLRNPGKPRLKVLYIQETESTLASGRDYVGDRCISERKAAHCAAEVSLLETWGVGEWGREYGWKYRPAWRLEDGHKNTLSFFLRFWHKHVKDMAITSDLVTPLPWMEIECVNLSLITHRSHVLLPSLSMRSYEYNPFSSNWTSCSYNFQLHVSLPIV